MITIDGRFWLNKDGKSFLGDGRVELLEKIAQSGSIHAAAKEMKMSYKAAWDRLNSMNALADMPIIEKTTGGKGGGGTVLTPHAYELIATYKRFRELHSQFMNRFSEAGDNPEHLARVLSRTFLTTSARNQLMCKVQEIKEDELKGTLILSLKENIKIHSIITLKSIKNMGITDGSDIYAIIKSSDILITSKVPPSTKNINILDGKIKKLELSKENIEITFELENTQEIISIMKKEDSSNFSLDERAYAIIPYESIILGM